MEALGLMANVVAVVDISAKVLSLCFQYSQEVKSAKQEIDQLRHRVEDLSSAAAHVQAMLDGPQASKLRASKDLADAVDKSLSRLNSVSRTLNPSTSRKTMSRFGIRALKWPFQSEEFEVILQGLSHTRETITLALQVDQITTILDIDKKLVLDRIPVAEGASFDSHAEEHNSACLHDTRLDLLGQIYDWIEAPSGKAIFWLNGMAGTGKSTISRTIASSRAARVDLGASFLFKKGETDRGNLTKFFSTLARQLASRVPNVTPHIIQSVEVDPTIFQKSVREQFDKLIMEPMSNVPAEKTSPILIVVDALDECDREADSSLLIHLLSHAHARLPQLRIFVSSRPELPIRLGFNAIRGTYQDVILHEIPIPTVEHDISIFLHHELGQIRQNYNLSVEEERALSPDWPGEPNIEQLVTMAIPLFIFATTLCRFINDRRYGSPGKQLRVVLDRISESYESKLEMTYAPILKQQIVGLPETRQSTMIEEFRLIVGSIIMLSSPLSKSSLARLLDISVEVVDDRLDLLHSVLHVPLSRDQPVRLFHLSFRDYLVDRTMSTTNPFWIDKTKTHNILLKHCFRVMRQNLRRDICNIRHPGRKLSNIDPSHIKASISSELQYSALHWIHHQVSVAQAQPEDDRVIYDFLSNYFLHWLEVMTLLGRTTESLATLRELGGWLKTSDKNFTSIAFTEDAIRYILANMSLIDEVPLQIYCSALLFAPAESIVRNAFNEALPEWITVQPKVEQNWPSSLAVLENCRGIEPKMVFSPDSKSLAIADRGYGIGIWNVATGKREQYLEPQENGIQILAFSGNQSLFSVSRHNELRRWDINTGSYVNIRLGGPRTHSIAVFSSDLTLLATLLEDQMEIWNIETRELVQTLDQTAEDRGVTKTPLVFSRDARKVAIVTDRGCAIKVYCVATGQCEFTFKGNTDFIARIQLSPNGRLLASASLDKTVLVWNFEDGHCENRLDVRRVWLDGITFSPDSKLLSTVAGNQVNVWDVATWTCKYNLNGHDDTIRHATFSTDSLHLATCSYDQTVRLWNMKTGESEKVFRHTRDVLFLTLSHDGKFMASGSTDHTVRLWSTDAAHKEDVHQNPDRSLTGHQKSVAGAVVSPDNRFALTAGWDHVMKIWDLQTGELKQDLERHGDFLSAYSFTRNSKRVLSGASDHQVRLWDLDTENCGKILEGHTDSISNTYFSSDENLIVSVSRDNTVRIWDSGTGACLHVLDHGKSWIQVSALSADSRLLATITDGKSLRIWSVDTGELVHTFPVLEDSFIGLAFSPDSKMIASSTQIGILRLWDIELGTCTGLVGMKVAKPVKQLSFDPTGTKLMTEYGVIDLESDRTPRSNEHSLENHPGCKPDFGTTARVSWVTYKGNRLLWLPVECRQGVVAVSDSAIIIGCKSGSVVIVRFSKDIGRYIDAGRESINSDKYSWFIY